MRKKLVIAIVSVAVLAAVFVGVTSYLSGGEREGKNEAQNPKDFKNATYTIDGRAIMLANGVSEIETVPGSASKTITRYFGNVAYADLNSDGREDAVFLLTQETGGSGTFFYAVAAIDTGNGYAGSQGFLLGDRIAPQTTELSRNPSHKNVIVVNYAVRAPGEPMTARPSVGKSVWLKLNPQTMQFGEVVQNFEGESK